MYVWTVYSTEIAWHISATDGRLGTQLMHCAVIYTGSQKNRTPTTFWQSFIKKAQMSVIFDRDSCTSSVHLQLQVASLMLLRTICSFHGNDSRHVGWLWTGDFWQSDWVDQWRKRFWAFMKAKGEQLLWLAVAYCLLLQRIVSNNI